MREGYEKRIVVRETLEAGAETDMGESWVAQFSKEERLSLCVKGPLVFGETL